MNSPGIASDARTAFSVEPFRSQTSAPFSTEVATAANGILSSSIGAVLEAATDERHEALPFEQPAAEADVGERQHVAAAHPGRAGAKPLEIPGCVGSADERTHRRPADEVGPNPGTFERAQDADVRPAARGAAAEDEAEPRCAPLTRDERLYGRDSRPETHPSKRPNGRSKWCKLRARGAPRAGDLVSASS